MPKACCAVLGICAALVAGAADAEPLPLNAQDMDAVTAGGVDAAVISSAAATGPFNYSETSGAAIATRTEGSNPALTQEMGLASGNAVAVGAGPGGSASTSVATSSSTDGTFVVNRTYGWKLAVLSGEISAGFSVSSGRFGAFLLGGP